MLRQLVEYEQRHDTTPTLYTERPVRYVIELDVSGRLRTSVPLDLADPSERTMRSGRRLLVPSVQRAVAIKPILLADKADYTLGTTGSSMGETTGRVEQAHAAYVALVRAAAAATARAEVQAVLDFLTGDAVAGLQIPGDFDAGSTICFSVDGTNPVDLPEVRAFWADYNAPPDEARLMQCLVCGRHRPALDRLQLKVKGIPGGQTSGTSIISANADAFESYGLKASLIAPTCADCGEGFTKAINRLVAGEDTSVRVGRAAVYVFWTRDAEPFSFASILSRAAPDEVAALLRSVHVGSPSQPAEANAFYAAALSGSGGRAVVRQWIESTVAEVSSHLRRWFDWQRIVAADGSEGRPLGLWALAAATDRELNDVSPNVPTALVRSALAGTPLPSSLMFAAVKRNAAEQGVDRSRAALVKLVLASEHPDWKDDYMVELETGLDDPAYLCGRLLAVLERAQWSALGIRSVSERFYGAASTAPASVFGRLIRGAQPHLARLERDRRGAYFGIQRDIEDVVQRIGAFPNILTLKDQGRFALGYYHQRAADRAAASERKALTDNKGEDTVT
jgi:CRISPR-associated protein Csd1